MFKSRLVNSAAFSLWWGLCLVVGVSFVASAQAASPATPGNEKSPDATEFLKQTSSRYSHLQYFHIESAEETQINREAGHFLLKQRNIAAVAPGNRYRFESIGSEGTNTQVSDGKNEWLYDSSSRQYVQHPTPASGYENPAMPTMPLRQVQEAQAIARSLSTIQNDAGPAHFLSDEILDLDGTKFPCRVVLVLPKVKPESSTEHNLGLSVYWIDNETHVFRKVWNRFESKDEGGFSPGEQVSDTTTIYRVAELGTPAPPASLFTFTVPPMASRVVKLEDRLGLLSSKAKGELKVSTVAQKALPPAPVAKNNSESFVLLRQVAERYAGATYFHIEAEEEGQGNEQFIESRSKERRVSILEPGNRYRFELIGARQLYLRVADGKNEWIYQPVLGQYTQQATQASGPGEAKLPFPVGMLLEGARNIAKDLAKATDDVTSTFFLPDETIDLYGQKYACRVVAAQHNISSDSADYKASGLDMSIYWIDKDALVFRKVSVHRDVTSYGPFRQGWSVHNDTTTYPVVELGPSPVPDSEFAFTPPATASRVAEFDQGGLHTAEIENKPAPEITFHSEDGKTMSLQSWRGKPVLLDFWATWCGPCIASLPGVEKIYHEFESKGLAVISVDEDDSAKDATDFLVDHKRSWPNFHDEGGKIRASFPRKGIPYFVLIDAAGKIAYASTGFFDTELRAALAKLGPEFTTPVTASKQ